MLKIRTEVINRTPESGHVADEARVRRPLRRPPRVPGSRRSQNSRLDGRAISSPRRPMPLSPLFSKMPFN